MTKKYDDIQAQINDLTRFALNALGNIVTNQESKGSDIIAASKVLLDLSGLKRQEISGGGLSGTNIFINREGVNIESNN